MNLPNYQLLILHHNESRGPFKHSLVSCQIAEILTDGVADRSFISQVLSVVFSFVVSSQSALYESIFIPKNT